MAYESLLLRQRRQLHERVGALLETGGGDPSRRGRRCWRTTSRAATIARAPSRRCCSAAAEAEQLPSFRTALDLYRQAWEIGEALLADAADEARVQRWVMEATVALHPRHRALRQLRRSRRRAGGAARSRARRRDSAPTRPAGLLRTLHGMLLTVDPERFAEGVAITEAAVAEARQSGDMFQALSASRAVAWHYLLDGRFDAARTTIEWVERGLQERAELPGAPEMLLAPRA